MRKRGTTGDAFPGRRAAFAVRSSLKAKLAFFIVAMLGLTIGIAPWGAIKMQERQLLETSQQRLNALEQMLRRTITANCILTGGQGPLQRLLEAVTSHQDVGLGSQHDIESVRLFDTTGAVHYSSRPDELGTRLTERELSRYYGHPDPIVLAGSEGTIHTLARPIFNQSECLSCHPSNQKVIGILQVSLSIDRVMEQLGDLRRFAFTATLITLAVIAIGIWLALQHLVDQPLHRLVQVMARAEHGDLTARAEVRNNDEIGQLGRHFNDMISKLEAAQQELQRYHHEQLARADRLATIGEMAAAIAHEIRNPLTGISGAISVLSRDFPIDDPRREVVRQTRLLIDRLNKSVENILHYSRPSLPQLQKVRLEEVVGQTLSLADSEAKKAGIEIVKQVAEDGSAELPTVSADPHQIQQVLMNLILNAIQASKPGAAVRVRTYVSGNHGGRKHVCVEVEDSGKGMTPEQLAKAFQPFFSTKAQGTGLGLPIAKQIVERHHGRISLHSAPGEGTRVAVELPAHADAPSEGP